jgi:polyisoprenoid-binding protein YceI
MTIQYKIDPSHSSANFSIKHMMISKAHGGFDKISGVFVYDSANPENSKVEAEIEVASIKSVDFFDGEKFPLIIFSSKSIKARVRMRLQKSRRSLFY